MNRRIFAIFLIFVCSSVAWLFLAGTIAIRTGASGEGSRGKVESSWGTVQQQAVPYASWDRVTEDVTESIVNEKVLRARNKKTETFQLPLEKSHIQVQLDLDHRQKGLLWFSTYKVRFAAEYEFRNDSHEAQNITICFPLPAKDAIYDDLTFALNGLPIPAANQATSVSTVRQMQPGEIVRLGVGYNSQGLGSWFYSFGSGVSQVHDIELVMNTNFKGIDFPENTISPSEKRETPTGWQLGWKYKSLLSGYRIGTTMPEKLQPGPLAGQISTFAPVSLFFFFFVMFIITALRNIELHPMNYFFLATAFFAFHLLLAYLVDHISIHAAFVICSAVSIFSVGQLFAAGGGTEICRARGRSGAVHLPRLVFLRLFLQRLHRAGRDHRFHPHSVCGDANDRKNPLAGKVCLKTQLATFGFNY
ncbi:MAG: hypothetical protein HY046_00510 [Acidobacteria bacterium]|nr:hypothetical protein [Acidobacteriota bacterium]